EVGSRERRAANLDVREINRLIRKFSLRNSFHAATPRQSRSTASLLAMAIVVPPMPGSSAATSIHCFAMLTERSARLLDLTDYGLAVGNPADVVVFDAQTPEQAIAEIRNPLAAFKRGRQTMMRRPPELLRP